MTDDGWRMADDGWRMADDGWRMTDDGWRMTDGGWRMADDGWRMNYSLIIIKYLHEKPPLGTLVLLWLFQSVIRHPSSANLVS
jgi:hypothetical protein